MATHILIVPESLQVILSSPRLPQAKYTEISNWGYLVFSAWFRFPERFLYKLRNHLLTSFKIEKKMCKEVYTQITLSMVTPLSVISSGI